MSKQRTLSIPLIWHWLGDLRRMIEETLEGFPKDVRDATSMVAAELVSNAIKYGVGVPGAADATMTLSIHASQIRLDIRNGCVSLEGVWELQQRIAQICQAESKESLYMERLQQLLDDPTQTGKLGLYRIGFEGQFDLSSSYIDQIITVTATRGIP